MIKYLEDQNMYDQSIYVGFITRVAIGYPNLGYRTTSTPFTHLMQELDQDTRYSILLNFEKLNDQDVEYLKHLLAVQNQNADQWTYKEILRGQPLELVKKIEEHKAFIELRFVQSPTEINN